MTADESAAVALAFAALRARASASGASRPASGWSSASQRETSAFDGAARAGSNGHSAWMAAARLEALREDV